MGPKSVSLVGAVLGGMALVGPAACNYTEMGDS
jgi:hypothetical protein